MLTSLRHGGGAALGRLLAAALLSVLALPVLALALGASAADLRAGLEHPLLLPALGLSLRTSAWSLAITIVTGTPLAFWLARHGGRASRVVEVLVELPILLPPAVVGVALLQSFGRRGLLGPALQQLGVSLPFSSSAVVLAQVVVSAPFFVQAAANAFRDIDPEVLEVARTLGASRAAVFLGVAVPIARPGLLVGASLAWARALGEFGATLLFAGNLPGTTQTLPLAIFTVLQSELRLAVVFSLVLTATGALLVLALRLPPAVARVRHGGSS